MNEAERILVVFLSSALALFLVLAIIAVYKFIQFLDHLKTISEKAEKIADNAENISDFFRQAAGPALIGRLLAKISSNFYKSKKSNRRKHSDEE